MGNYANIKIEYYIISQVGEFVNGFCKNISKIFQKVVQKPSADKTKSLCLYYT